MAKKAITEFEFYSAKAKYAIVRPTTADGVRHKLQFQGGYLTVTDQEIFEILWAAGYRGEERKSKATKPKWAEAEAPPEDPPPSE